jgi:hypothetical protein
MVPTSQFVDQLGGNVEAILPAREHLDALAFKPDSIP